MAAASSPQFFRIILQINLQDRKLMIPKKFVKDYGKFLSSASVRLKLPDGMEWKVGLTTGANGVVWLQKGWHQFAEHYCLEFGSLLVFRLDENSSFHTTIFDPTGLETEYSWSNFNHSRGEFEVQDSDSDSDSYVSFPRRSKKREKASIPCRQSRKKLRNDDSLLSPKIEPEEEGCNIFKDMPSSKKLRMPKDGVDSRRRQNSTNYKAEATQRFSSKSKSKSEKQPTFKVVMTKSNVGGRFNMFIPKDFAEKYLCDELGIIKLQTPNGRNWPLLYKWSQGRGGFAYISSGWKHFVEENLLKEGDVGIFQMIKKDKFLFTKLPSHHLLSPSANPFFEVDIIFKTYKNATLNIPMGFAKEHLTPQMKCAKLQVGNKEWKVSLKQYESCVRFSAGWSVFYLENGLEDRDSCLFEMLNKKDCVFQVTIFKKLTTSASMD